MESRGHLPLAFPLSEFSAVASAQPHSSLRCPRQLGSLRSRRARSVEGVQPPRVVGALASVRHRAAGPCGGALLALGFLPDVNPDTFHLPPFLLHPLSRPCHDPRPARSARPSVLGVVRGVGTGFLQQGLAVLGSATRLQRRGPSRPPDVLRGAPCHSAARPPTEVAGGGGPQIQRPNERRAQGKSPLRCLLDSRGAGWRGTLSSNNTTSRGSGTSRRQGRRGDGAGHGLLQTRPSLHSTGAWGCCWPPLPGSVRASSGRGQGGSDRKPGCVRRRRGASPPFLLPPGLPLPSPTTALRGCVSRRWTPPSASQARPADVLSPR